MNKILKVLQEYWMCVAVLVVGIVICLSMFGVSVKKYKQAEEDARKEAKSATEQRVKEEREQEAKQKAKEEYKVTNKVTISVDSLRNEAKLEVLEVYDEEYVIENEKSNKNGIESWLKVPGKGVYTVDLAASEFIVDNERQSVFVRVPEPQLENYTIIYKEVEQLLFENGGFNESIAVGEEVAKQQLMAGYMQIGKTLGRDPSFYQSAERSAEWIITELIKSFNAGVENLTVEVEFFN